MSVKSRTFFGHPAGLYVLFFTEMWERFSFYGMKTLLVLYMINHFFWSQERASGLLGTYAALAYGLPVVGGFIADRYLGAKRAVILGAYLLYWIPGKDYPGSRIKKFNCTGRIEVIEVSD